MRLSKIIVLVSAAFFVAPLLAPAQAGAADGKTLIGEKKCTTCHSVKAAGIEKTKKKKGPDLSGVGKKYDAAHIEKFLKKEVEHKSVFNEGKQVKHKKKFKGSDEELKAVATFLAAQKSDLVVKDEGGEEDDGDDKE